MGIEQKIMIAGPCAAQSREQIVDCAQFLQERGINMMRASLWKPRTAPGFEGVGIEGLPWMAQATNLGISIGTEVLMPNHVTEVVNGVAQSHGDTTKLFMWIGSRNQNHMIQRQIAERVLNETPKNVKLMVKNQPWFDISHSVGIVEHVLSSGISPERLVYIWRGFKPHPSQNNPNNFRNMPEWEAAMLVKERLEGIPMIIDPSHIGGSAQNIMEIVRLAAQYSFDGTMVEVNPLPPEKRATDKEQQLDLAGLDELLNYLK